MGRLVKRGEVYWRTFPPPVNRRPVLVLTRDSATGYLSAIVVAEITTTIRDIRGEVVLDERDGFEQPCAVSLYNLHTVKKGSFEGRITALSEHKMQAVEQALCWALGMEHLLRN